MTLARTPARRRAAPPRTSAPLTAVAAVLGGAAWSTAAVLHARQPVGCVGDAACGLTPMREATTATSVLMGVAGVLMALSGVGLLRVVRRATGLTVPARVGATLAGLGVALLATAVTVQEAAYDGDFPGMPWLVGPGVVALALGVLLIGGAVLRSPVLPRWTGAVLMVSAALLVLSNEQTTAVLLAVPFGLSWAAMGVALARRS